MNKIKLETHNIKKGMYVSELDRPWSDTPFLFQGFRITNDLEIEKLNTRIKSDDFLGKGTVTISEIKSGSPSLCAVADYAYFHLDRRLTWGETKESAVAEIEAIVKAMNAKVEVLY